MIIISQGPLVDSERIEKAWPVPVIHSTWEGEKVIENAIYSQKPIRPGVQNVNLQRISTLNGLKEAEKQGFKQAFKFRSDMVPTNAAELLKIQDEDSINFLFWHNYNSGYFVDYVMSGPIDSLIELWNFQESLDSSLFPERLLTNRIKECKFGKINFFGSKLSASNDILWIKNNIYLSSYNQDSLFL